MMNLPWWKRTVDDARQPECPLVLDEAAREAFWCGQRLDLSSTELAVLTYLFQRAGQAVLNDALLQAIWGTSLDEGGSLWQVRSAIKRLRQKLTAAAGRSCQIASIRGVGYRLDIASSHQSATPAHPGWSIALRIGVVLVIAALLFTVAAGWRLMRRSGGNPTTLVWYRQQRVPAGVLWLLQRGQHCAQGTDGALYCFDTAEERATAIDVMLHDTAP